MSKKSLICLGVALVVGLVLGALVRSNLGGSPAPLKSGEITSVASDFVGGVGIGDTREIIVTLKLEQGEQFKAVQISPKSDGRNVEIVNASISTVPDPRVSGSTGVASSTFMLWMGTSSASTLPQGTGLAISNGGGIYATDTPSLNTTKNLPFGGVIDGLVLATSTSATTTMASDLGVQRAGRDNASGNHQANSSNLLYVLMTAGYDQSSGSGCNSQDEVLSGENSCETATSTARGFNVVARFILRLL